MDLINKRQQFYEPFDDVVDESSNYSSALPSENILNDGLWKTKERTYFSKVIDASFNLLKGLVKKLE